MSVNSYDDMPGSGAYLSRKCRSVSRGRQAIGGQDLFERSIVLEGALDDMQRSAWR
jgi:hypothetical protein